MSRYGATFPFRSDREGLSRLLRVEAQLPPFRNLPQLRILEGIGEEVGDGFGKPGSRPSAFARTGSKSTNHDLKSARAIASSVSFIRRFNSILSSSVPRMWAMARCSGEGGSGRRRNEIKRISACAEELRTRWPSQEIAGQQGVMDPVGVKHLLWFYVECQCL